MKVSLKFEDADFETLRKFESAVKRQLGNHVYVGTNSLCLYFDYPKQLAEQLRPVTLETKQYEFELESSTPDTK